MQFKALMRALLAVAFTIILASNSVVLAAPECRQLFTPVEVLNGSRVRLFDDKSNAVNDYREALRRLTTAAPGTVIDFGRGESFVFKKFLGAGETTFVVETMDGKALRIPLLPEYSGFINEFYELQGALFANGVRVIGLDRELSRPPRFLVVAKEEFQYTLADFLENRNLYGQELNSTAKERAKVLEKLKDFARTTWRFDFIGDFNETQLGYNGNEWILFDFAHNVYPVKNAQQRRNIFSPQVFDDHIHETVPQEIYKELEKVILAERRKMADEIANSSQQKLPWIQRKTLGSERMLSYLISGEVSSQSLIGNKLEVSLRNMRESARKRVNTMRGWNYADFRIEKILKADEDSVLYQVRFHEGPQGLLEISTTVLKKKDEDSAGHLLKKAGYKKSDWDANGPDYALVLK